MDHRQNNSVLKSKYMAYVIVKHYCDETRNKTRCLKECAHVCVECGNESCVRLCSDACYKKPVCDTP
jgi:hypothetical protein